MVSIGGPWWEFKDDDGVPYYYNEELKVRHGGARPPKPTPGRSDSHWAHSFLASSRGLLCCCACLGLPAEHTMDTADQSARLTAAATVAAAVRVALVVVALAQGARARPRPRPLAQSTHAHACVLLCHRVLVVGLLAQAPRRTSRDAVVGDCGSVVGFIVVQWSCACALDVVLVDASEPRAATSLVDAGRGLAVAAAIVAVAQRRAGRCRCIDHDDSNQCADAVC